MKATLIKNVVGWRGDARLYRVDPPIPFNEDRKTKYVVVSGIQRSIDLPYPETYIFPASSEGKIPDWLQLPGSFQGAVDHARALEGAGYSIE